MEPHKMRQWTTPECTLDEAHFYTCARPGRSKGRYGAVPDALVSDWVRGLPEPDTAIVSLLGRKRGPEGLSEFSFYSFCGGLDTPTERRNRLDFQEWLDQQHAALKIQVSEHPSFDLSGIPEGELEAIARDVLDLMTMGYTVVVVDSGGETRTNMVCKRLKAVEDSRSRR